MDKFFFSALLVCLFIHNSRAQSHETDYSECLTKVHSAWSTACSQCLSAENTYRVYLKNTCNETVESKVCVREKANRWRIFHFRSIAPGDSVSAYACEGTGKYMHITRKAGDMNVLLPDDNEIQKLR
jgi:Tfp pilus assembly protein PilX